MYTSSSLSCSRRYAQTLPSGAAARPPTGSCTIKGNINAKGRRIFHQPGQRDYSATVIDAARGERWFCSPAEAQAQGWTPAQR